MSQDPRRLGDVLREVAKTLGRADLGQVDELRRCWREHADPELAVSCVPQSLEEGRLIVSVPTGAHAERVRHQSVAILSWYADLGAQAPTAVVPRVRRAS
ncbi:MAG: DciA family protein [Acidimicrobiales bacterium]